jgi:hypothetical protein
MWKSGVENVSDFFEVSPPCELRTELPVVINRTVGVNAERVTRRLELGRG